MGRTHNTAVLMLLLLLVGCATAFPRLDGFLVPPYAQIVDGLRPSFEGVPERLPALERGQKVVFHVGADGGIGRLVCSGPLVVRPAVPSTAEEIGRLELQADVNMARRTVEVRSAAGSSGVRSTTDGLSVLGSSGSANISLADASRSVGTSAGGAQQGLAVAARQTQQARATGSQTASLAEAGAGGVQRGEDVLRGAAGSTSGTRARAERGDESETDSDALPRADTSVGALSGVAGGQVLQTEAALRSGRLLTAEYNLPGPGSFRAGGATGQFIDDDLLRALIENELTGYFDSDVMRVLDEMAVLVPLVERERLIRMLREGVPLAELLDSDLSAAFRQRLRPPAGARCQAEVRLETTQDVVWYGHYFGLLITVENTGDAPVFDALILNGLPRHTSFVRFALPEEGTRGFTQCYLPENQLVAVRLYRPIMPGESFKVTVVLRAAAWSGPLIPH